MTSISNPLAGVDFTRTDSAAKYGLGTIAQGQDGVTYQYIEAGGALTANLCYHILQDYKVATAVTSTTAAADATRGSFVCFPQVAVDSGDYAWVAIGGKGITMKAAASCAADTALHTSATAGTLDDTVDSHYKILGGAYLDDAIGSGGAATETGSVVGPACLAETVGD
jgi:hypothetical protein